MNTSSPNPAASTKQVVENTFLELIKRGKIDSILSEQRSASRIHALLSKFHVVAGITIPIPNLVAFYQLRELPTANTARWVAEALFILKNQNNPDTLFLRGIDRERKIHEACAKITAYDAARYFIAIREVLEAIEKKNTNSSETILQKAQNLINLAESSPSPSNSDGPPKPSSTT